MKLSYLYRILENWIFLDPKVHGAMRDPKVQQGPSRDYIFPPEPGSG